MAWKGRGKPKTDYQSMKTDLVSSEFQKENKDIFDVLNVLLDGASSFEEGLESKLGKNDSFPASQLSGMVPPASGGVVVGRYDSNPLILITNLAGAGVDFLYYMRSGDTVTVFGRFQVTPTAIGVNTELGFQLPILSYFTFDYQCAGSAYSPTVNQGAAIMADVGNNRAKLKFLSTTNITFDLFFTFGYVIIPK